MEVREKVLSLPQTFDLDGLRLLHLHDHVGDRRSSSAFGRIVAPTRLYVFVVDA